MDRIDFRLGRLMVRPFPLYDLDHLSLRCNFCLELPKQQCGSTGRVIPNKKLMHLDLDTSKNPYSYRYLGKHVKPSPRYGLIIHFHSPSLNIPKPSTINRQTHPSRAKVGTVSRSWPWAFRSEAPSSPPNQQQTAGGTAQHTTTPGEDRVA